MEFHKAASVYGVQIFPLINPSLKYARVIEISDIFALLKYILS